ncbi:hypothetical protein GGI09_000256 [Coemansia sp. S100]|nr:hypothetical protein GGI09_000256 [Coemansia sp. S100]
MTARSTEGDMELRSSPTMVGAGEGGSRLRSLSGATDVESDPHVLASENFSFSTIPGGHHNGVRLLFRNALRRNRGTVWQQATPRTSDSSTAARELAGVIATDLEAHLSIAAKRKRHNVDYQGLRYASDPRGKDPDNDYWSEDADSAYWNEGADNGYWSEDSDIDVWGKGLASDPRDVWTLGILEWAGFSALGASVESQQSDDVEHSNHSKFTVWKANEIAPSFRSFVLFVAHHVKASLSQRNATALFQPEDCRLILPFTRKSREVERAGFLSTSYVDSMDFAHVECGMFPLSSNVERQAAPASHLIVADAEIARTEDDCDEAELRLATRASALYFNQHNRRFTWGLTASNRTIRSYVFGPDDIWQSTEMDITSAEGRQALISLLVSWSLCSVDSLGFDPSIRYVVDRKVGDPYLVIDIHKVDTSTGKVGHCTYYSKRCVGAADRLTGRHARYFAVSTTPESMDRPTFLIKDVWTTTSSDSAGDTREISFLKTLRDAFGGTDKLKDGFSDFVSTGPVYVNRGGKPVLDSTATAFAELPSTAQGETKDSGDNQGSSSSRIQGSSSSSIQVSSTSRVRQHRRTVLRWPGNMISAADNPSQVVIAIADAMVALSAAYTKCKILHGNLSDRAIQFQKTADGIRGVLAEFDYASYAGASPDATRAEAPELMLFRSIRSLGRQAVAEGLDVDDREHVLAPLSRLDDWESILYIICILGTFGTSQARRNRYPEGSSKYPYIKLWSSDNALEAFKIKRIHMNTADSFYDNIAEEMVDGPLRRLAVDMHRILFLHPDCHGTRRDTEHGPLARRDNLEQAIVAALLALVEQYRREALAALSATGFTPVRAELSAYPLKSHKRAMLLEAWTARKSSKARGKEPEV